MIHWCFARFYFQISFSAILITKIYSLQHPCDSGALCRSLNSSDQDNDFPIRCNPLSANAEKQVGQIRNPEEKKAEDLNGESILDVNQTLSPTPVRHAENTVCYDDLGCITRFSFADPLLWPINSLPETRENINTHFTLHTRENPNPKPPIRISAGYPNEISATTFKATRPTKFFIHGWVGTGYENENQLLLQRLLIKDDFNVINVHWGGGAFAFYFQAHANSRLVGLEIALLVNTMVEKLDVQVADVHLIGFSMGAHSAGYAGKKIPNLGHITGLDPAALYFRRMPAYARLDYTDAQFVDVVHTNAGLVGINEPTGHIDFYPNGGKHQPGCDPSKWFDLSDLSVIVSDMDACDHRRSVRFYSAALQHSCQIVGYECSDYDSFSKGKCTSCGSDNTKCAPFGLEAINYPSRTQANVKFFFNTDGNAPYCMSQYLVLVKLAKPPSAKAMVKGLLRLSVIGEDGRRASSLQISVFEHGKDHRFLLNAQTNLGPIQKVYLRWKHIYSDLDRTCFAGMCNKRLYVNSVTVSLLNSYPEVNRIANTYVTCPRYTPAAIPTFQSTEFNVENSCSSTFHLLNLIWNNAKPWILY